MSTLDVQLNDDTASRSSKQTMDTDIFTSQNEISLQATTRSDKPATLDDLLDKVGVGKYQYLVYTALTIGYFCDGAELIAISFLNVVLVDIWKLSEAQVGLIGVAIFGGLLIGSFFAGPLTDLYGRRKVFMGSLAFTLALCLLSALSPDFTFMLISRGFFGISAGVLIPISSGYIIEITPTEHRGRMMVFAQAFFTLGEMFACGIVAIVMYDNSHWRLMLVLVTVPGVIAFVILLLVSMETPRFAFFSDSELGFSILNKMYQINKGTTENLQISELEKEQVKQWVSDQKHQLKTQKTSYIALFLGANLQLTSHLIPMWFLLCFVYYGIVYVYPMTLVMLDSTQAIDSASITDVFISVLGEIPSYVFCYLLVDHKSFGRKNSLILCFAGGAVCLSLSFFVGSWGFPFLVFGAKFFANSTFAFIYLYTSEAYHTSNRVTGVGLCSGVSRFSGVLMPWIVLPSLDLAPKTPFLLFGLMCGAATVASVLLPFETLGRELDKIEEGPSNEHSTTKEISMTEMKINAKVVL